MRIAAIFIITFFAFFQKGNAKNYFDVKTDSTVIYYLDLPDSAYKTWSTIYDTWHYKYYSACLKKNKLKLSCGSCTKVYMEVVFEIDKEGKLVSHQFIDGKQCGQKPTDSLIKSFMKYWYTYSFPLELRNIKMQVRLGTGLKC